MPVFRSSEIRISSPARHKLNQGREVKCCRKEMPCDRYVVYNKSWKQIIADVAVAMIIRISPVMYCVHLVKDLFMLSYVAWPLTM